MHIKKTKHTFANGSIKTQIALVESYRPGKGMNSRTRTIKDYGYLEDKPDPEGFLDELQSIVNEARRTNQKVALQIDMNMLLNDPANRDLIYGPAIIRRIYEQLHIPEFIKANRKSKAQYDLNAILCYLTCMKIVAPDSKRSTYMDIDHVYGMDASFKLQDIYASLDEISELRFLLQKHLQKEISRMVQADKSFAYLDVTNTYMEVDFAREGGLAQRGVSKEHRTEPIIQQGLLLDSNGLPLLHECFPGNTSDSLILKPMVEKVKKENMTSGRIIVVADKGLNSGKNIDYLCNDGNGYVFSQVLKGNKGKRYHDRLFNDSLYTVSEDSSYKWQLFEETYIGLDKEEKKVTRHRNVLLYWSAADAAIARKKRNEKINRAKKALKNNAYTIDHSKMKYIKTEPLDKATGEILPGVGNLLSIDEDQISEDSKFDGYFCLITSELNYDESRIREVYHNLWLIENTFRMEKTDHNMRPVYVWKNEHIRAHFMIGHLAALITRLIQLSMGNYPISPERIQRVLRNCVLDIPASGIVHLHEVSAKKEFYSFVDLFGSTICSTDETGRDEVSEDFFHLSKALGFSLQKAYMRLEQFNRCLNSVTLPLHTP